MEEREELNQIYRLKKEITLDNIFNRTSIRLYSDRKVSKEDLELLVKAGMAAPSALDRRPWHFVVITDRELLNELSKGLPYCKMLLHVNAAIAVCGKTERIDEHPTFWLEDCCLASENILLAAKALGLGGVYTAVYPQEDRMKHVIRSLQMPEGFIPLNIIPIGYPAEDKEPKDKWNPEQLHWNKW